MASYIKLWQMAIELDLVLIFILEMHITKPELRMT